LSTKGNHKKDFYVADQEMKESFMFLLDYWCILKKRFFW